MSRPGRQALPLVTPALLVIGVLFLFPGVYNVVLAFQDLTPFDAPGDAEWAGLANFQAVLTDPLVGSAAVNTVFWLTAATVIIRLVIGMGLALLLHSRVLHRWRLRGFARTAVLVPWMVPPVVAVACWKWIFDGNTGVLNQFLVAIGVLPEGVPFLAQTSTVWWSVIAIIVWRELPFVVIVLLAGLQSVPEEQYEAAALDGAGRWASFRHITLPSLRPVITVVVLMTVIQTFNNFVYVWLSTGGGPGTYTQVLATQLYSKAFVANSLGEGAAIGLAMTAVMAVFALAYLRVSDRGRVEA
ncbi:carbohydrate ABC transporter permease [Paractinoplanes lichenicola]|uniref:Sugar ABC transporter permease n=1 Tax=Paractinoplanes lichenicola TaxID=2802976 RepID=A0ABS1VWF9_9ACTN|nr:sugar ABC transporter permease [Actinoplanes lichenicola]MBL7258818.1 sugar ABC transporter permease [Actinoplanes lichenicola]